MIKRLFDCVANVWPVVYLHYESNRNRGAGFIGSHLVDRLLDQGDEVIAVDNLCTGHRENVAHLENSKQSKSRFKLIVADVIKPLPKSIFKVDRIYHLASPASPSSSTIRSYQNLWEETMAVNTIGTWNLVKRAVVGGARFLFALTSETYGELLEHPQKETYRGNVSTTGPRAVYDEAKRFGETIVSAYVRKKGLDGRIARIFNTYGPRMDLTEGRVVYNMAVKALRNEPVPIYGDGKQTRSFCYVSDQVEGLIRLMEKDGLAGEVVNIGNLGEFTILELAERIIKLTKSKSKLEFFPMPTDDPTRRQPDITKAKKLLNWEPKVNLDEGLEKTLEYIKVQVSR